MSQKKIKAERRKEKIASSVFRREKEIDNIKGVRQILKENWKFLLILLMGVVMVYFNSLWGDFVSDDYASITQNPMVYKWALGGGPTNIVAITTNLLAVLFGIKSPIPFHLFSLGLYLLVIVSFFIFVYIMFGKNTAKISSIIFAIHPVHVESVSWISGKPYLYVGLFQLLAYIGLVQYVYGRKKYLYFSIIFFILSFLSSRVHSLTFVFMVPLILFYLIYEKKNEVGKKLFWKSILIILAAIPVILLILWPSIKYRVDSVNFGYRGDGGIFYDPFFQYPTSIAKYLQLLWFPIDLTLYHTMYTFPVWLNWLILFSYLSLTIYTLFKNKDMFFCLAFILLATAPTMAPVKVSWLVAERYIFLGSIGWCIFLVLLWEKYFFKYAFLKWSIIWLTTGLFAIKTILRNIDWQTNHNLWVATVQVSPNSHNAWNNIGDDYDKLGDYENAIKGFTQSTVMKPNYADAYHNRANIYFKTGYFDLARQSYLTALSFNPKLVQTYISLVQIELTVGRLDAALDLANKVVEIDPNNFQVRYVRAVVLKELNMLAEAKKEAEMSLRLKPDYDLAKNFLLSI